MKNNGVSVGLISRKHFVLFDSVSQANRTGIRRLFARALTFVMIREVRMVAVLEVVHQEAQEAVLVLVVASLHEFAASR